MDSDAAPAVLDVILLDCFPRPVIGCRFPCLLALLLWQEAALRLPVSPLVWLDSGLVGLLQLSLVELVLGHIVSLHDPGGI